MSTNQRREGSKAKTIINHKVITKQNTNLSTSAKHINIYERSNNRISIATSKQQMQTSPTFKRDLNKENRG
jgi:hypothetical protein